jgi:hypothetical protein
MHDKRPIALGTPSAWAFDTTMEHLGHSSTTVLHIGQVGFAFLGLPTHN